MFKTCKYERLRGGSWIDITLGGTSPPICCCTYPCLCSQFRAAVVEAVHLINEQVRTSQILQANHLSPGEVLGFTSPSGLYGCSSEVDAEGSGDYGAENNMKVENVVLFFFED